MNTSAPLAPGDRLRLSLKLAETTIETDACVTTVHPEEDGVVRTGIRFDGLDSGQQNAILRWCFTMPFGPGYALGGGDLADPVEPALALLRTA